MHVKTICKNTQISQILCYIQPCGDITLVKHRKRSKRYSGIFNNIENEKKKNQLLAETMKWKVTSRLPFRKVTSRLPSRHSIRFLHAQVGQPSSMGSGVDNNLHLSFPITSISLMNCGNGRRKCLIKIDLRYLVQFKNIATQVCSILQELIVCFLDIKIGDWPTSYVANWQPWTRLDFSSTQCCFCSPSIWVENTSK